jgi:hypothetical protein
VINKYPKVLKKIKLTMKLSCVNKLKESLKNYYRSKVNRIYSGNHDWYSGIKGLEREEK